MQYFVMPAATNVDGVDTVVNDSMTIMFRNPAGDPETFGAGDFQNAEKLAEAQLIPMEVDALPAATPYEQVTPVVDMENRRISWTVSPIAMEDACALLRAERDRRIQAVAWRIERHASETRQGMSPTDDIAALDAYVQALRDLPGQAGFPWDCDGGVPWPDEV